MAELLKAMLLDIPEVVETARPVLRGPRAGAWTRDRLGARRVEITSLAVSCMYARAF